MARPGNTDRATTTRDHVLKRRSSATVYVRAMCYGLLLTEEASPSPPDPACALHSGSVY